MSITGILGGMIQAQAQAKHRSPIIAAVRKHGDNFVGAYVIPKMGPGLVPIYTAQTTIPKAAHPGNCHGCGAPLRRDHGCNHCGRGEE